MFQHSLNERIGFERTAYFFKICFCLHAVAVHTKTGLAVQIKLLACIVVNHAVQTYYRLFPLLNRLANLIQRYLLVTATPYLFQFLQCPRPLVRVVMCMHLLQTFADDVQRDMVGLYVVQQTFHFVLGNNQSCHIHPIA